MKSIFYIILTIFLSSCVYKMPLKHSKSAQVILKTPSMRYADSGFIRYDDFHTNLELFNISHPILDITIKDKICINQICYQKKAFNKKFFNTSYNEDFLEDILHFRPILNSKNIKKTENGFIQNLEKENIFYEVNNEKLTFHDKINKIFFKIKIVSKN